MLEDLYRRGILYDWENYQNCHVVTLHALATGNRKTIVMYKDRDERNDFINLFQRGKWIMIGFNNLYYDDQISNYLINNPSCSYLELWEFGQTLIKRDGDKKNQIKFEPVFDTIDLLEIIRAGYNTKPLKMIAVNLNHHRIQELPIPFNQPIEDDTLSILIDYNHNDLDITKLLFDFLQNDLQMRELLTNSYGVNFLGSSKSDIGKKLVGRYYFDNLKDKGIKFNEKKVKQSRTIRKQIDMSDVIFSSIKFETKELQDYVSQLRKIILTEEEKVENIEDEDE